MQPVRTLGQARRVHGVPRPVLRSRPRRVDDAREARARARGRRRARVRGRATRPARVPGERRRRRVHRADGRAPVAMREGREGAVRFRLRRRERQGPADRGGPFGIFGDDLEREVRSVAARRARGAEDAGGAPGEAGRRRGRRGGGRERVRVEAGEKKSGGGGGGGGRRGQRVRVDAGEEEVKLKRSDDADAVRTFARSHTRASFHRGRHVERRAVFFYYDAVA
mmetsp:Transcript_14934/g.53751  ORF Transcript_14934/g.53751 Transcript_14934/m.53751 type:complete len:224 (+) Transcript_14934:1966-2637(+)